MSPNDWWRHAVVYQVYPRSFADSDGDGMGDIPGLITRLDYLADLGVDAIWISPFYTSPLHDGGYDVADYRDISPDFGTLADADEFIARHDRARVAEPLIAVHDARKVDRRVCIGEQLLQREVLQHDRKRRRSHHIGVPGRASSLRVVMEGGGTEHGARKLAHLFASDKIRGRRRKIPTDQFVVHRHPSILPSPR